MTVERPITSILRPVEPKVTLQGPLGEITIGEITISIWCKPGHISRVARHHGRIARDAADARPTVCPNPCIIPLDPETAAEGGPFVYAHVLDRSKPRDDQPSA